MNWKFGGKRVEGEYTFGVNIKRTNRPWPPPDTASQSCVGWYHGLWDRYDIYGAGFSDWDYGQKTLLPSASGCAGMLFVCLFSKDGRESIVSFCERASERD